MSAYVEHYDEWPSEPDEPRTLAELAEEEAWYQQDREADAGCIDDDGYEYVRDERVNQAVL